MFSKHKFKNFLKLFVFGNFNQLISPAHGETSSFLSGATVTMSTGYLFRSSDKKHLIDNSYKAMVHSDGVIGPSGDFSFWFEIDLGTPQNIKTVFIVNRAETDSTKVY